ncbi:hypothetical protein R6Z07_006370 [Ovis aries]
MGILAVRGTAVPGKSPLTPRDSVQGLCLERGQGRPPPSTHPNPIDVNGGGDASRSPESWAAGSPPTRPAVCSTPVCLSHHGFVRLLQHLKRYVCPRSLGSDHVSGDLRVARARALGPRVDPPPARERRGPIGRARGSQASEFCRSSRGPKTWWLLIDFPHYFFIPRGLLHGQ